MKPAIRINYTGITHEIIWTIKLTNGDKSIWAKALWDTGCSKASISQRVVDELGLKPYDKITVYEVGKPRESDLYHVTFELSAEIKFEDVEADQSFIGERYDAIIGMGIISKGNFIILNQDGRTNFVFMPI